MNQTLVDGIKHNLQLSMKMREAFNVKLRGYVDGTYFESGANNITGDMADDLYLLKEWQKFFEGFTKDLNKTIDSMSSQLALLLGACDETSVRTEWCTATNKTSVKPGMPKFGTEEYAALMLYLGQAPGRLDEDSLRPHWPTIKAICERCLENGEDLPPGIDPKKTDLKPTIAIRGKGELLAHDLSVFAQD